MATAVLPVRPAGARMGAVLLAALLAGCSSSAPKPAPFQTPSASTVQTPSAVPSSTAHPLKQPTPSNDAQAADKAGAAAFARFYLSTVNYAMASGDTSAMSRWATEECSLCGEIRRDIRDVYRKGGTIQGGGWKALASKARIEPSSHVARLRLRILVKRQVIVPRRGAAPSPSVPNQGHLEFKLIRVGRGWKVDTLGAYA